MINENSDGIRWDSFSSLIIIGLLVLQLIRWLILPQFMDVYYHLLTAWGFIQAGGYTGWDFWQFAPVGRPHIYPPLFHLVLAGFMKAGISPVILAKLCESLIPVTFLLVLWKFIKDNYGSVLAFFVVLVFLSSFSFYLSLLNHIPATIALILGVLSLGQLFKQNLFRSSVLLALCFYTHIGISWFFAVTFISYGALNREAGNKAVRVFIAAFILALPIVIKELNSFKFMTAFGFDLNEKYYCQIKIVETILALIGLSLAVKMGKGSQRLFLAMFLASFIFVIYPYRFLSAEGYFPVLLLSAFCLYRLYQKVNRAYLIPVICVFILAVSPTFSMNKETGEERVTYKIKMFDSGFLNILFAKGDILWFPGEYIPAAKIIEDNSEAKDIVYCTLDSVGLTLSSIAGRASANALLPEIKAPPGFNPLFTSKIIVFTQLDSEELVAQAVSRLNLIKVGENKFFLIYKNPNCLAQANIKKASLPFWAILCIAALVLLAFWRAGKMPSGA
jgi:hypothetical protein